MIHEEDLDVQPVRIIDYDYAFDNSPSGKARLNFESGVAIALIIAFIIGSILY